MAENTASAVMDNLLSNEATTKIMEKFKLTVDQSNVGFDPFGMLGILIAGAVLLFILFGFVGYKLMSKNPATLLAKRALGAVPTRK
jgi:hypothetical protein